MIDISEKTLKINNILLEEVKEEKEAALLILLLLTENYLEDYCESATKWTKRYDDLITKSGKEKIWLDRLLRDNKLLNDIREMSTEMFNLYELYNKEIANDTSSKN